MITRIQIFLIFFDECFFDRVDVAERSAVDVFGYLHVLARNKLEAISWKTFHCVIVNKIELKLNFYEDWKVKQPFLGIRLERQYLLRQVC